MVTGDVGIGIDPANAGFDSGTGSTAFLSEQTGRVQFTSNSTSATSYYYYTITADAEL